MSGLIASLRARLELPRAAGDPVALRALRLLQTTLLVGIGITVALTPVVAIAYSPRPRRMLVLNAGLLVALIVLLALARRGRTHLASWLLLSLIWAHVSAILWWSGGLRAPVLVVFFPLVLLAAVLLGPRASGVTLLLSLVSSLSVLVAEATGRLPAEPPPAALHIWIVFVVTLLAIVAIGHLNTADLLRASRSRQSEAEERRRAEERLREAQKLETVGRLTGVMAHDFNNLLMVITGHGELLRRSLACGDARASRVEHIMSAAERAARLVRHLLAFNRGEVLESQLVEMAGGEDGPPPAGSGLPPTGGKETVLVVEDKSSVRNLAHELLAGLGYRVLCAASGEDALALADRHPDPVDLLLADVVMPGLACEVVVERLRTRLPDLRVLYMSGQSAVELARRGVDPAGYDLLPKPFDPDLLARRVREALDRRRDDSTTREAPTPSRS